MRNQDASGINLYLLRVEPKSRCAVPQKSINIHRRSSFTSKNINVQNKSGPFQGKKVQRSRLPSISVTRLQMCWSVSVPQPESSSVWFWTKSSKHHGSYASIKSSKQDRTIPIMQSLSAVKVTNTLAFASPSIPHVNTLQLDLRYKRREQIFKRDDGALLS